MTESEKLALDRGAQITLFKDLFENPAFLYRFCQALFPDQEPLDAEKLKPVFVKTFLYEFVTNDIAFTYKNKPVILVDTPNPDNLNFIYRAFFCYTEANKMNLMMGSFGLPVVKDSFLPSFYVMSSSKTPMEKEVYSLRNDYYDGDSALEVIVHTLPLSGDNKTILDEYARMCQIFNEQLLVWPKDGKKAQEETIRICLENDILKPFLENLPE